MKILVTGASTPLGVALIDALLASPDVDLVFAVARDYEPPRTGNPRFVYRQADLARPRVMHDLLWGEAFDHGIDRIVHGMQHRAASDHGRRVHVQNVDATRELLQSLAGHPTIRRLVYRSFAEVYAHRYATTDLLDEESPLALDPGTSQWVRDRVEADLYVCAHLGRSLEIAVLRLAEILAPNSGSQLWDYLQSRVCLRPLGFDPMINVLSISDAVAALMAALRTTATGVFNIAGFDTLPLSHAIFEARRADLPVPGPLMAPLYGLRRTLAGFDFHYDINLRRFHFGGVLDDRRARTELGYVPRTAVRWPEPWWQKYLERLSEDRPSPS